ncbi:hypothetical protein B0H14DRAFT_2595768 [Mycena olivaceomarginata]|nr:hypothetical protein B0H14DRAFT_2595768 [Mycena olivaceomarginata]
MVRPVGSQDLVFRWLEVSIEAIKKIMPKSCGEIFKLKKLVKLKTKVGEIVGNNKSAFGTAYQTGHMTPLFEQGPFCLQTHQTSDKAGQVRKLVTSASDDHHMTASIHVESAGRGAGTV